MSQSFNVHDTSLTTILTVYLLSAGWATSLSAGESDGTREFSFFKVNIDLTDAGHGKYIYTSFFYFCCRTKKEGKNI